MLWRGLVRVHLGEVGAQVALTHVEEVAEGALPSALASVCTHVFPDLGTRGELVAALVALEGGQVAVRVGAHVGGKRGGLGEGLLAHLAGERLLVRHAVDTLVVLEHQGTREVNAALVALEDTR